MAISKICINTKFYETMTYKEMRNFHDITYHLSYLEYFVKFIFDSWLEITQIFPA